MGLPLSPVKQSPPPAAVSSTVDLGSAMLCAGGICAVSLPVDVAAVPSVLVCGPLPLEVETASVLHDCKMRDHARLPSSPAAASLRGVVDSSDDMSPVSKRYRRAPSFSSPRGVAWAEVGNYDDPVSPAVECGGSGPAALAVLDRGWGVSPCMLLSPPLCHRVRVRRNWRLLPLLSAVVRAMTVVVLKKDAVQKDSVTLDPVPGGLCPTGADGGDPRVGCS